MSLTPPSQAGHADDWIGITDRPLPLGEAASWPVIARCGAVALFAGTVRAHSEGRPGVLSLEYEAYEEHALSRLRGIAAEARRRWPEAGRLVLLHRTGKLLVEEVSVVTAASAPHRSDAFDIARYLIDTLKVTVPIWKRETWAGGEDWAACAHDVVTPGSAT
ncbi:MAG: molybdenum cofactor biosynthesis protein MoaE [Actinobacteria bacterium]|jgi:molybdopterin synthase catalytic subunit|nr:molybdenum cofactor biosynthesis protein MoaE [Actinomycetota bacterium]